jgi:hypothetical protein
LRGEIEMIKTENCVVRTLNRNFSNAMLRLEEKLEDGWVVKSSTPFIDSDGKTDCVEYILERFVHVPKESSCGGSNLLNEKYER